MFLLLDPPNIFLNPVVLSFAFILLILFGYMIGKVYLSRRRRIRRRILLSDRRRILSSTELSPENFEEFLEGDPESINPDMTLDDQIGLLPYNAKYEFPRDRLKLCEVLGAGAFGMVRRAIARGIFPYEKETIVAVKTVKQTIGSEVCDHLTI